MRAQGRGCDGLRTPVVGHRVEKVAFSLLADESRIEEDVVKELGFPHAVIMKLGFLVGDRNNANRRAETILSGLANGLGVCCQKWLTDWWVMEADVVAKAAIAAASRCAGSNQAPSVWEDKRRSSSWVGRSGRQVHENEQIGKDVGWLNLKIVFLNCHIFMTLRQHKCISNEMWVKP